MALRLCAAPASALWLTLLIGMPVALAEEVSSPPDESATPAGPQTVQAIWKHQEIAFYFQSFTTFYSCVGLEGKLDRVMRALGVHAKIQVRSADCPFSVARMPRVVMQVASPVVATPEAYAERDTSVRELTERVKGKSARPIDSLEEFPAQWRKVSLTRGRLALEPGDCELIEELQRKVLPKLAVRITDGDVRCSPNQLTVGQPRMEVEALVEVPPADASVDSRPVKRSES